MHMPTHTHKTVGLVWHELRFIGDVVVSDLQTDCGLLPILILLNISLMYSFISEGFKYSSEHNWK